MYFKCLLFSFFIASYCHSQSNNILSFKILSRRYHEPIMAASLRVDDSLSQRYYQNYSDSSGIMHFNLSWLQSDSAYLSLRVATDTLTTFTIYKNKIYGYEMVYYVDTEAIKKKNEAVMQQKKRKG